ncbi:PREDICTED: uncharacterized protein LOC109467021, partial [Branchiostoma belcheri]|uniref:Uncharacterized protein LOC109467021 n=1 Tax=Branchiostoma belcheri TaxID=7741 RepID=A0A6P4YEH6_BRABE
MATEGCEEDQETEDSTFVEDSERVWCVGDRCQAPCSYDGQYYTAVIRSVHTSPAQSTPRVTVKFCGFESDENEEVPVAELRKLSRREKTRACTPERNVEVPAGDTSMFSPLQGDETRKHLGAKFAKLEDSDEDMTSPPPPPLPVGPQKYKPLKLGGKRRSRPAGAVQGSTARGQDSPRYSSSSSSSHLPSPRENENRADSTGRGDHSFRMEGFSDEDYEKPFFRNHSHVGKKEPFVLSPAGETPVVQ